MREWGNEDLADPDDRSRYDFLALQGEGTVHGDGPLVVIEVKQVGHPVEIDDLYQLERYATKLGRSRKVEYMLFVSGDIYAVSAGTLRAWEEREDGELTTWRNIYQRTRTYYEHYRAVLEGVTGNQHFDRKGREVARTRQVLQTGAYRGPAIRKAGLGPQDVDLTQGPSGGE